MVMGGVPRLIGGGLDLQNGPRSSQTLLGRCSDLAVVVARRIRRIAIAHEVRVRAIRPPNKALFVLVVCRGGGRVGQVGDGLPNARDPESECGVVGYGSGFGRCIQLICGLRRNRVVCFGARAEGQS